MTFLAAVLAALPVPAPQELIVERMPGSVPVRVSVRCEAASVRRLVVEIARAASFEVGALPGELDGVVGPVTLLSSRAEDAIEAALGAAGYLGRVEQGVVRVERCPHPGERGARERLRSEAISQFQLFLATAPDHEEAPRAWLELAALHQEAGNVDAAIRTLSSLEQSFPGSKEAVRAGVRRGRLEFDRGRAEEAGRVLFDLIDRHAQDPTVAEAYPVLGRSRLALDDPATAMRYFEIGIERFPDAQASISSRIWRVEVLRRRSDLAKAVEELAQLEHLELPEVYALELLEVRTLVAETTKQHHDAAQGWLALAAAAADPRVRAERLRRAATSASAAGEPAIGLCALAASRSSDGSARDLGLMLLDLGLPSLAARRLDDDPISTLRAARRLADRGERDAAARLVARLELDGPFGEQRRLLEADLALAAGRPDRVPDLLAASIESSSNAEFVRDAMRRLGDAYKAMGDPDRAALAYRGVLPKETPR